MININYIRLGYYWNWLWLRSSKAPWTHLLIPSVERWVNRAILRVPLTYHMT